MTDYIIWELFGSALDLLSNVMKALGNYRIERGGGHFELSGDFVPFYVRC